MDLYNFFTEIVYEDDVKKMHDLKIAFQQLKEEFGDDSNIQLIEYSRIGKKMYSIIGQILGEDTNYGDVDLMVILKDIKYSWFDAFCPEINSINI